jgi:hypothetical protein
MKRRSSAAIVIGLIITIVVLRPARPETASPTLAQVAADLNGLKDRVVALEGQVSALQTTVPRKVPNEAPTAARTQASSRNCTRISESDAPIALRRPISSSSRVTFRTSCSS